MTQFYLIEYDCIGAVAYLELALCPVYTLVTLGRLGQRGAAIGRDLLE